MKKILLTGGSGFIGRNILPILQREYTVDAPSRNELDVYDEKSAKAYVTSSKADVLVHCAIATSAHPADNEKSVLESTLRSFLNLKRYFSNFEKVIYIGSGAEYDKSDDIHEVVEEEIGCRIPKDEYGLAKYTMNEMAQESQNVFNLRIFGCYGPYEPPRRFIRHAIECCLNQNPVTIRQECRFSYVFVDDLARAILAVMQGNPLRHDYNICGDMPFYLSELAEIIQTKMNVRLPITILDTKLNAEYTGKSIKFKTDFSNFHFTSIEDGIEKEILWKKENR